jgi:hypothetical protein
VGVRGVGVVETIGCSNCSRCSVAVCVAVCVAVIILDIVLRGRGKGWPRGAHIESAALCRGYRLVRSTRACSSVLSFLRDLGAA